MRHEGFWRGFGYAWSGIVRTVREERNMRFHLVTAAYVLYFSAFYPFTRAERLLIIILIAGVFSLEMINTAFERAVSNPQPERYEAAGYVKDIAAGAVLVFCIAAAVCGGFLFFDPAVIRSIGAYFCEKWYRWLILAASLAAGYSFVFTERGGKHGKQ